MVYENNPTNPIEQLINILEKSSKIREQQSMQNTFSRVLGLEKGGSSSDDHRIFYVFHLICEVEKSIYSLPKYRSKPPEYLEIRLRPLYNLKAFLLTNAVRSEKSGHLLSDYLRESSVTSALVAFNDDYLEGKRQIRLSQDFVSNLLAEFKSVQSEIFSSNLDLEVKKFISDRILEIICALENHDTYGTEKLREAINSNIGEIVLNGGKITAETRNHPAFKKYFSRLLVLSRMVASPISFMALGIGFSNDMENYIIPKYEQYQQNVEALERKPFECSKIDDLINILDDTLLLSGSPVEASPSDEAGE